MRRLILALVLSTLAGCATMQAAWGVAKDAAIPAAVGGVTVAAGMGPVAAMAMIFASDVTMQAVDGEKLGNEMQDAIIGAVKAEAAKEVRTEIVERFTERSAGSILWRYWWQVLLAVFVLYKLPNTRHKIFLAVSGLVSKVFRKADRK